MQAEPALTCGEDTLLDVNEGSANATGTCACAPRKTSTVRTAKNNKNNAGRYRLTELPPQTDFGRVARGVEFSRLTDTMLRIPYPRSQAAAQNIPAN